MLEEKGYFVLQIVEFEWTVNGILVGNCLECDIQLIFSFINLVIVCHFSKGQKLEVVILCWDFICCSLVWTVMSTSPFGICLFLKWFEALCL